MKAFFLFLFVAATGLLHSQIQVTSSVVAAAGASGTAGGMAVCSTLGEAAIFSAAAGGLYFGQGFHTLTPGRVTSTVVFGQHQLEVVLYPNPSTGVVSARSEVEITAFRWFSATGQLVGQAATSDGSFDMTYLPAGTYYIQAQFEGRFHNLGQVILTK